MSSPRRSDRSAGKGAALPIVLLDNSAVQRLRNPLVRQALVRVRGDSMLATCLPILLEQGFSARSEAEHTRLITAALSDAVFLSSTPGVQEIAIALQSLLFRAGKGRAAGVSDLQIAATAIHHSSERRPVVLVHYDRDFDHIASVEPRLHSRWIVPPGSVE